MRSPCLRPFLVLLAVASAGCAGKEDTTPTTAAPTDDLDADGFTSDEDCDDDDASVHPGAEDEPYDGVDADCSGGGDSDADGDGSRGGANGDDCDDDDPDVNPDATEVCDGIDNDCSGDVDDGAVDSEYYYGDGDGDGYGDGFATESCDPVPGSVTDDGDCDDDDPTAYLGAPDVACDGVDNDCIASTFEDGRVTLVGSGVFPDLEAAIDAASAGAEIELCEGRYPVHAAVGVGLTIRGAGADVTELDADGEGYVLRANGSAPLRLEGVRITGGTASGITVADSGDVTLVDVVVSQNECSTNGGGGILVEDYADLHLVRAEVSFNTAQSGCGNGGGIALGTGCTLTLEDSSVTDNENTVTGLASGGGISAGSGTTIIGTGNSAVSDNAADFAGGISIYSGIITGLTIDHNVSLLSGGGIDSTSGDLTLTDVSLLFNEVTGVGGSGGGAALGDGVFVCSSCIIDGNYAFSVGGGLQVEGSAALVDSVVTNNDAVTGGGVQLEEGVLTSTNTDWGVGASDNVLDDVFVAEDNSGWIVDGVATFSCDRDGCL